MNTLNDALAGAEKAPRGRRFVIKGPVIDSETLYWSNRDGWVDRASATEMSAAELASGMLLIEATAAEVVEEEGDSLPRRYTAALLGQMFGLHQTIVEIATIARQVDYCPPDSFDLHRNVVDWAVEWEGAFQDGVAGGMWHADEWIERTEDFAMGKLAEHSEHCGRWTVRPDGVAMLPSMKLPAIAATPLTETPGDTFINDGNGNAVASYGPRVLKGSGGNQCVEQAVAGDTPQFWGVYRHDAEGLAECVGDALDEHAAKAFADVVAQAAAARVLSTEAPATGSGGFRLPTMIPFLDTFRQALSRVIDRQHPDWLAQNLDDCQDQEQFDNELELMIEETLQSLGVWYPGGTTSKMRDWMAPLHEQAAALGAVWPDEEGDGVLNHR